MIANDLFGPSAPSVACVDVPAFPLQLVLREHPEWKEDPVVIVEEDRPTAAILWANRPAREARIRRGMKFAQARSLVARLHGEVVPGDVVADAGADLLEDLLGLTPNVEPDAGAPGLFWLDPCGLAPLYGSLETWASRVHARLEERSLVSSVVVGWQRGTVFAVARTRTGATVLPDPDAESRRAARVPLARIGLSPDLLRSMAVLGVHTIGEFAALPASGLELRYGEEAARWHAVVSGCAWTPFRACRPEAPPRAEIPLDPPDHDHTRLLFGIKTALHPLLDGLAERDRGVTALQLTLELDHAPTHQERIETASPTRHVTRLVDLVRLRLAHLELPAAVERIVLVLESRELSTRQTDWARPEPRRDPRDLANALARLRASFGAGSVVRARIVDTGCPERRFRWEAITSIEAPRNRPAPPGPEDPLPLVRGVLPAPRALPDPDPHERHVWLGGHGAVETMLGPGRLRTGWWDELQARDYYWVETRNGSWLWVFRSDRKWFLHGVLD